MRVDLVVAAASMPAMPPVFGHDNIAQALITETLAAALDGAAIPARWSRHRLITRASTAVSRWLADDVRRLSKVSDAVEPDAGDDGDAARSLRDLLIDVQARRLPPRGIVMLYRQEVLGESLTDLAAEANISVGAPGCGGSERSQTSAAASARQYFYARQAG